MDFTIQKTPQHLPKRDLIPERLISPQIPFMQIRRLRHIQGQFGIYGHIINVPVYTMFHICQASRDCAFFLNEIPYVLFMLFLLCCGGGWKGWRIQRMVEATFDIIHCMKL
jgi:hypothetical protein